VLDERLLSFDQGFADGPDVATGRAVDLGEDRREEPAGSGRGTLVQRVPSKWSARPRWPFSPTAQTSFAAKALTP